ncbi:hypothetical protein Tco_0039653 [Tanacetum coccineum]
MTVEESLKVTFDESPPPTKLSPLVDDDVGEEEAIKNYTKVVNNNNEEDESIEVDEIVDIKESKNHPLDQVDRPECAYAVYPITSCDSESVMYSSGSDLCGDAGQFLHRVELFGRLVAFVISSSGCGGSDIE